MKKNVGLVVLFVFLLFVFVSCVSMPDVQMSEVIDCKGQSKDKIYRKMNEWGVRYFNNVNSVIQYVDKEEGILMGKCMLDTGDFYQPTLMTLEAKDEKCRISLETNGYPYNQRKGTEKKVRGDEKDIRECYAITVSSLKAELNKADTEW